MTKKRRKRKDRGAFATDTQVGDQLGLRHESTARGKTFDRLSSCQQQKDSITPADIEAIASKTAVNSASVRGVASFYSLFDYDSADENPDQPVVRICDGPACCLHSGHEILDRATQAVSSDYRVQRTSCLGFCDHAPVMMVETQSSERRIAQIESSAVDDLLSDQHGLVSNDGCQLLQSNEQSATESGEQSGSSERPLTKRFGSNAQSITQALKSDAYAVFAQALLQKPKELIDTVEASGLRGRGGAGFNTGTKWRFVAQADADQRYVICNADESEPGTFKDRVLMENDPHALIEGMAICARAVDASEGIIYIRGEYSTAASILERAIEEARSSGWLGQNIRGTDFDFDISIHRGAGAYICGEETALLESLEGKRGEPRDRPPFPATHGYWGKPTVVNNVETLCNIPAILNNGAEHYRNLGNGTACGTKLFCLSGHVAKTGVCEASTGTSTRDVIDRFAGGMRPGSKFKCALTGGAAGKFIPEQLLDVPLSFDAMSDGVALGSGAIIVADESVNVAEMLLWVLNFFVAESCGKCTPCRVGTVQARDIVQRIVDGDGQPEDEQRLLRLATTLSTMSLCGLGVSVDWPITSAIEHFRTDFGF